MLSSVISVDGQTDRQAMRLSLVVKASILPCPLTHALNGDVISMVTVRHGISIAAVQQSALRSTAFHIIQVYVTKPSSIVSISGKRSITIVCFITCIETVFVLGIRPLCLSMLLVRYTWVFINLLIIIMMFLFFLLHLSVYMKRAHANAILVYTLPYSTTVLENMLVTSSSKLRCDCSEAPRNPYVTSL